MMWRLETFACAVVGFAVGLGIVAAVILRDFDRS